MKILVDLDALDNAGKAFQETAYEVERIRKEAEQQLTALLETWQGADGKALQETFYTAGGLNEFCKRMAWAYIAFHDHFLDAKRYYQGVSQSLADAEAEASAKSGLI